MRPIVPIKWHGRDRDSIMNLPFDELPSLGICSLVAWHNHLSGMESCMWSVCTPSTFDHKQQNTMSPLNVNKFETIPCQYTQRHAINYSNSIVTVFVTVFNILGLGYNSCSMTSYGCDVISDRKVLRNTRHCFFFCARVVRTAYLDNMMLRNSS